MKVVGISPYFMVVENAGRVYVVDSDGKVLEEIETIPPEAS